MTDDPARSSDRAWSDLGGYVDPSFVLDPRGLALPASELAGLDPLFHWVLHCGREAAASARIDPRRTGAIFGNLSFPTGKMAERAESVWFAGTPFARPPVDPRNRFTIMGPTRAGRTVKDVIIGQMQQPYFPVTAEMIFRAQVDYRPFAEGDRFPIGEALVTAIEVNHPGGNLSYRVDYRGKSVVFATDHEHGTDRDAQLERFSHGADVLIYDAMYSEDEYRGKVGGPPKIGWGHSTWQHAVKIADGAGVKQLLLYHHDPTRTDKALEDMVKLTRKLRAGTSAAREGETIQL
jgi:phosphoribosyl 1,2-cyclic phosphodiesterase